MNKKILETGKKMISFDNSIVKKEKKTFIGKGTSKFTSKESTTNNCNMLSFMCNFFEILIIG